MQERIYRDKNMFHDWPDPRVVYMAAGGVRYGPAEHPLVPWYLYRQAQDFILDLDQRFWFEIQNAGYASFYGCIHFCIGPTNIGLFQTFPNDRPTVEYSFSKLLMYARERPDLTFRVDLTAKLVKRYRRLIARLTATYPLNVEFFVHDQYLKDSENTSKEYLDDPDPELGHDEATWHRGLTG